MACETEMNGSETRAYLYVVGGAFGPVRIGVAIDPRKRRRELQVGSPLKLELALAWPCANRLDADAVVEELYRRFAARRAHGRWYRVSAVDVRSALANPATLAAPAKAAAARTAAAEAAAGEARVARRGGRRSRARTEKELAYQRRRRRERAAKQRRAARLIGRGMTQTDAAAQVGVSARTLRNWSDTPGFRRELARQRARADDHQASAHSPRGARRRTAPPLEPHRRRAQREPDSPADGGRPPGERHPSPVESFAEIEARRLDSYERWLDSNQAPRPAHARRDSSPRAQTDQQATQPR